LVFPKWLPVEASAVWLLFQAKTTRVALRSLPLDSPQRGPPRNGLFAYTGSYALQGS
jgi:hypothetical protein